MRTSQCIDLSDPASLQQQLFGPYDFCEAPKTEAVVVYCGDPRYRKAHKGFFRAGLRLGTFDEQYVSLPIPGGAALFAHPEELESYYAVLTDCLETYCTHFDTVTRFILVGHSGCKHMAKVYRRLGVATDGEDQIFLDLVKVAQAYGARSENSQCVISRLFAMFNVQVEVYYLRPSTRISGKIDVEKIRV